MENWASALYSQSSKLEEILAEHETNRKKLVRNMFLTIIIDLALSAGTWAYIANYYPRLLLVLYIIAAIGTGVFFYAIFNAIVKNKRIYKKEVIPLLTQALLNQIHISDTDEIHYEEEYKANIDIYETNPLFEKGNKIRSEDLFYGQLGKTKFTFYEADYIHESGYAGKNHHIKTIFDGLTFIADFNKNFEGLTTISVGKPKGLSFFDSFNDMKKVTLETNNFSKKFDVYSTNGQEARYIINTAFMERIMQLSNASKKLREKHVSILFRNSCMEVYLPNTDDHFDPKLMSKTKVEDVNADFETMELLLSLISVMQLNTRIWTKE